MEFLRCWVFQNLECDFSGSIRLTGSKDLLADANDAACYALLAKHLTSYISSTFPPPPDSWALASVDVPQELVVQAMLSSPFLPVTGSQIRFIPQHLKDLLNPSSGVVSPFYPCFFSSHVLIGQTLFSIHLVFWSQIECSCTEKRRCTPYFCWSWMTWRPCWLLHKAMMWRDELSSCSHHQMDLQHVHTASTLLKLDFSNAFNVIQNVGGYFGSSTLYISFYALLLCHLFSLLRGQVSTVSWGSTTGWPSRSTSLHFDHPSIHFQAAVWTVSII